MKLSNSVIAGFCSVLLFGFVMPATSAINQGLTLSINEVMASNSNTIFDEDGDAEDWIELYNYGEVAVSLLGLGLSDDYNQPFRWVFPEMILEPGELLLVWASGKNRRDPDNPLHTNFSIDSAGEEIILTTFNGERLDELAPVRLPTDVSIGRKPDGTGEWFFFNEPTPGFYNTTEGFQSALEKPVFSYSSGFYQEDFDLRITHPESGVTIYYTLDGSEPTTESDIWVESKTITNRSGEPNVISMIRTTNSNTRSEGWNEPGGLIPKATVIRARAYKNGHLPSEIHTKSYFVFPEGAGFHTFPVFSLVTEPVNLFDFYNGIYVPGAYGASGLPAAGNFQKRGIEWEREGSLEFFETNGDPVLATNMGYRIHGGWSRQNAQKSLRLYARGEYGDNRFNYPFFPDQPYEEYNRIILRNSGNDWAYSMFRDAMAQRLVSHLNFETQAYRPAVLYINGEYWGIHNIRERYDRHYLERVYGFQEGEIDLLTQQNTVEEGDSIHWLHTLNYAVENDLSDDVHFRNMNTRIDMDNYLDYYVIHIFYANNDWPHNNVQFFRKRVPYDSTAAPGHDGRWRWMLTDLDRSFNLSTQDDFNMLEWVALEKDGRFGEEWPNLLFRNLMDNETFRNNFINRIADHLNTTFNPERLSGTVDSMKAVVAAEMEHHILRWQKMASMEGWISHSSGISGMYRFIDNRPDILRMHVRDYFDIESDVTLELDVSEADLGYIRVNSVNISPAAPGVDARPWPWTGRYFRGIPIEIEGIGRPGARFSYWEIGDSISLNRIITLPMQKDTQIRAVFEEGKEEFFFPEPFALKMNDFVFTSWPADAPAGTHPDHFAFVYMTREAPVADVPLAGFTRGAFDLNAGTRVNGLFDDGFSFANGADPEGNVGYPGRRLGGALLALDTRGRENITVSFDAGTIQPNAIEYRIRLQYRKGNRGPFIDLPDQNGDPIEYAASLSAGHAETLGPFQLPPETENTEYLQLFWRYHATPTRLENIRKEGAQLNISSIYVTSQSATGVEESSGDGDLPGSLALWQNYPNPFNAQTIIRFELPEAGPVSLNVYTLTGQRVASLADGFHAAGNYEVAFDAGSLASGVYIYRLQTISGTTWRKMMLVR